MAAPAAGAAGRMLHTDITRWTTQMTYSRVKRGGMAAPAAGAAGRMLHTDIKRWTTQMTYSGCGWSSGCW